MKLKMANIHLIWILLNFVLLKSISNCREDSDIYHLRHIAIIQERVTAEYAKLKEKAARNSLILLRLDDTSVIFLTK